MERTNVSSEYNTNEQLPQQARMNVIAFVNSGIFLEDVLVIKRSIEKRFSLSIVSTQGISSYKIQDIAIQSDILIQTPFDFLSPFSELSLSSKLSQARTIRSIVRSLLKTPPSLILIEDDTMPSSKIIVTEAKRFGIPVILCVPGLLHDFEELIQQKVLKKQSIISRLGDRIGRFILDVIGFLPDRSITGKNGCDFIFIPGESSKQVLLGRGIPNDRIVTVGLPRYYQRLREITSAEKKDTFMVLYASYLRGKYGSASESEDLEMFRTLNEAADKLPSGHSLVIKPHPMEKISDYQLLLEKLEKPSLVISEATNISDVLPQTKILITFYSTTIIEAMMYGALVIVIDVDGYFSDPRYFKIPTIGDIPKVLSDLFESSDRFTEAMNRQSELVETLYDFSIPDHTSLFSKIISQHRRN